ncbi:hypothetical protein GCM10011515_25230 [Tsuneonella deserti]|uniref:Uncharacterized protein n=1 Tax=Tsuneonella deserti TaxID=2035528 RepID=A0ABQ1SCQ9_9SPHN|nr:hypothetical protein [Tsuneonella deserti]GGE04588.1 hypothetical protein GCM10011515_25230 [Tsuneonella deserti]
MNATPTDFVPAARRDGSAPRDLGSMRGQWAALQDAAAAVAAIAGVEAEKPDEHVRDFPSRIEGAGGWRVELASNGISDISAMMRPGLKALLAVTERGQDPTAAALTLWREYLHARAALLDLLPEYLADESLAQA